MAFLDIFNFMDDVVDIPLDLLSASLLSLLDEMSLGIGAMFQNSVLDLSAINLDLSGLTDSLFGEGNSFLSAIFGEGGSFSNIISGAIESSMDTMILGLLGGTDTLLESAWSVLENLAPDLTAQISLSLDGAFDGLGDIFGEITASIANIIEPLTEEFSFLNLSFDNFGLNIMGALKGLFDIDIDELASMSIKLNKKMLEARVEDLLSD